MSTERIGNSDMKKMDRIMVYLVDLGGHFVGLGTHASALDAANSESTFGWSTIKRVGC